MDPMPCTLEHGMGAARGMRDKTLHILCVHSPAKLSLGSQQMERAATLRQELVGVASTQDDPVDSRVQAAWIQALQADTPRTYIKVKSPLDRRGRLADQV